MVEKDYSLGFKYPKVLAGLGRALHYSTEWTSHTDFVLDIIAPFYCSLVYRMMKDAEQRGIKRLYFCSRDAYMMYQVALRYKSLFPSIKCVFLYISRKALYDGDDTAKISYYRSVGLATEEDYVGIVDVRSSGRTLIYLNDYLKGKGYRGIRGYYYELFCYPTYVHETFYPEDYYTEWSDRYDFKSEYRAPSQILETFFPMNVELRTVDYELKDGVGIPVFENGSANATGIDEQIYIEDKILWERVHRGLQIQYADIYVQCGLYKYSDSILERAVNTFFEFFRNPRKEYLCALACIYGTRWDNNFIPFIKKESLLWLIYNRGHDTLWKEGTYAYNGILDMVKLFRKLRYMKL